MIGPDDRCGREKDHSEDVALNREEAEEVAGAERRVGRVERRELIGDRDDGRGREANPYGGENEVAASHGLELYEWPSGHATRGPRWHPSAVGSAFRARALLSGAVVLAGLAAAA